jgi:O-acetyl-ADP-ribose deacetylase (regulator of RNase III)
MGVMYRDLGWGGLVAAVREMHLGHTRVTLIQGEPIDHPRAALYAAVNARGVLASGFGGAIRLAAGGEIERELRGQGRLLVGEAYATGPGALAVRGVERVVFGITTPEPGQAPRRDASANALVAGLELIDRERLRSLTLPEVGVRVGGIALADAATVLIEALCARLRRGSMLDDVAIAGSHLEYLRACRDRLRAMGATDP